MLWRDGPLPLEPGLYGTFLRVRLTSSREMGSSAHSKLTNRSARSAHSISFAPRRLRAGQSDQMRLLLSIELFGLGVFGLAMEEGSLQALPSEPGAHPSDRRAAHLQGVGYSHVGPGRHACSLVGLEEDASMAQLARWGVAMGDQALQRVSILGAQEHRVVPLPRHAEASSCSLPRCHRHEGTRLG